MRLPLPCVACGKPSPDGSGLIATTFVFVELEGEHRFRVTCPEGHSSVIGLRQPRFKILYESGALALLDGYCREAVASVASSLERFHEYWVRATLLQKGAASEAVEDTWKIVASQSERQYGAFLLLYLRERNQVPPHLPNKWVQFRNDVVHRGEFPTRDKAAEYADHVLGLIAPLNRELQGAAPQGVAALAEEQAKAITAEGAMAATIATMVGRATDRLPTKASFQDELQLLDARRRGVGVA
jgi:hypothetical protein